jgi:hypothetical protein
VCVCVCVGGGVELYRKLRLWRSLEVKNNMICIKISLPPLLSCHPRSLIASVRFGLNVPVRTLLYV